MDGPAVWTEGRGGGIEDATDPEIKDWTKPIVLTVEVEETEAGIGSELHAIDGDTVVDAGVNDGQAVLEPAQTGAYCVTAVAAETVATKGD